MFIVEMTGIHRHLTMAHGECLGNEMISDIWRFPEGVLVGFSQYKPSIWGTLIYGNTHIYEYMNDPVTLFSIVKFPNMDQGPKHGLLLFACQMP